MQNTIKRRRLPEGDQRRILSPDALAIVQGRKAWPDELVRWKAIRELEGRDNIWEDDGYLTPAQHAHERAEDAAFDKYQALRRAGRLKGESDDEFEARLDRDAPWPYPPYVPDAAETLKFRKRAIARRALGGRV